MRPTGTTARRMLLGAAAAALCASAFVSPALASAAREGCGECAPADRLVGFGAGTTGGGDADAVEVRTLAEFNAAVAGTTPAVIRVEALIPGTGEIKVGSNKTIVGEGASTGFTGGGLLVQDASNVIIRNLTVSFAVGVTAIRVRRAHNVWIDHTNLVTDLTHGVDFYDGLVNITKGSDNVTVSWNHLINDFETSLIGAADTDGALDIGHEKVTFHHNWFDNAVSRTPSLRFGTGHVFNNFFDHVNSGVHSRMGAQMLIENNVFRNTKLAITTQGDSVNDGFANQRGNDFGGAAVNIPANEVGTFTKAPYRFHLDPTRIVMREVTRFAGAGTIDD
jgi:pectate lyase